MRRVLTLCAALAWAGAAAPTLLAQNDQAPRQERSRQDQQDIEALVKLVDGVSAGSQQAPADVPLTWAGNHFVRGADGTTYLPFTLAVDRSALAAPGVAMYVRVVNKAAAAAPAPASDDRDRNENEQRPVYPWDNIHFVEVPADGRIQRAMSLEPGNYELFIAVKERTPAEQPRNAPPQKVGLLRRDLMVPDFSTAELKTSSVMLADNIEPIGAPLTPQQQQEQPYTFGAIRVVPAVDLQFPKSGELQALFWIYGAGNEGGKPNLTIEYNFHQKAGDAEKFFNKTPPQELNAQTLPPQFNVTAGHQIPGNLAVPLASFPEGDYRLEIKITDKVTGSTVTQNENFSVVAG